MRGLLPILPLALALAVAVVLVALDRPDPSQPVTIVLRKVSR